MHTRELVNYLQGLAENNNRAWFVMNKPSYDILRAEFTQLVAQVIAATATKYQEALEVASRNLPSWLMHSFGVPSRG